ncbi:hypothetical protein KSP40_PGU019986 [Platanthera guangdongensis]|uniref:Uncharacterized protein n=1 Tax=Platanthera guangdongensis TaxID=2320717 RepID=A0ABR2MGG7_9ASPA
MSSGSEKTGEERAEAAAHKAADELADARHAREGVEQREFEGHEHVPQRQFGDDDYRQTSGGEAGNEQERSDGGGLVGTIYGAVQGTMERAKEVAFGSTPDAGELKTEKKAGEYKESAARKTGETKDKMREYGDIAGDKTEEAKEKLREYADNTKAKAADYKDSASKKAGESEEELKEYKAGKAAEAKDITVEKAVESKDATTKKATENKDSVVEKMGEYKEAAVGTARRAMEYLTGRREEDKSQDEQPLETTKEKSGEGKESACKKQEEADRISREEQDAARRRQSKDEAEETPGVAGMKTANQMAALTIDDGGPSS